MNRAACITGITGQDGSYLAELLLDKGYRVYGIIRRSSNFNTDRINHLLDKVTLCHGDVTDSTNIAGVLSRINRENPNLDRLEFYNLAAMSHVKVSFEVPEYTAEASGTSVLKIIEAIRQSSLAHCTRFYQASTSELYGLVQEVPQTEKTPFYPRSPYAVAKLYGFWITKNYRESYGMFAANGILFNHESPRRGPTFVTRKITLGVGKIQKGELDCLVMGNLDAKRDWGHARDYVEGMWRILQADSPDDYVLATNEYHSVREFLELAFEKVGVQLGWRGQGVLEEGYDLRTGITLVRVSERYYRPAEVEELLGDATKAKTQLGWTPTTSFDALVTEMVKHDS